MLAAALGAGAGIGLWCCCIAWVHFICMLLSLYFRLLVNHSCVSESRLTPGSRLAQPTRFHNRLYNCPLKGSACWFFSIELALPSANPPEQNRHLEVGFPSPAFKQKAITLCHFSAGLITMLLLSSGNNDKAPFFPKTTSRNHRRNDTGGKIIS